MDSIPTINLLVEIQENGIIRRKSDGYLIGRLTDDEVANFKAIKANIVTSQSSQNKQTIYHAPGKRYAPLCGQWGIFVLVTKVNPNCTKCLRILTKDGGKK